MSSAFVRETDDQWLADIGPSLHALVVFLTRENNGVRVHELGNVADATGRTIYRMSNGVSYAKDQNSKWEIVS